MSGPFTVESPSPDRIVSTDEERPASELVGQKHPGRADFATMILDNLRKAGVQNTFKNERLKFDRLESHAGTGFTPRATTPTATASPAASP